LAHKPAIVGMCIYDHNFPQAAALAKELKGRRPDLVITAGGPSCTFSAPHVMAGCPHIDYILRGFAEWSFGRFAEGILSGSLSPERIPGLCFRRGSTLRKAGGLLYSYPYAVSSGDLDVFPSPYLSGVFESLDEFDPLVSTSRGCSFGCTYCNYRTMTCGKIRYHSVQRVLEELKWLEGYYVRWPLRRRVVFLSDDAFTANRPHMRAICNELVREGLGLELACQTRADLLEEDDIRLLRAAGFRNLYMGLESASPRVLAQVRKVAPAAAQENGGNLSAERAFIAEVERVADSATRHGLRARVSVIFGLPGETPVDRQTTVDFLNRINTKHFSHNILQLYPGTEMFRNASALGLKVLPSKWGLPYITHHATALSDIAPIEGSPLAVDRHEQMTTATLALAGITPEERFWDPSGPGSAPGNGRYPILILLDEQRLNRRHFDLMRQWLSLPPDILLAAEATAREQREEALDTLFFEHRFPVGNLFHAPQSATASALGVRLTFPFHHRIDLGHQNAGTFADRLPMPVEEGPSIVECPKSGIPRLTRWFEQYAEATRAEDKGVNPWLKPDCILTNECIWRFRAQDCLRCRRLVVHEDGRISHCFLSEPIAEPPSRHDRYRQELHNRQEAQRKARGCDSCAVRATCSQCPFIPEEAVQDFCRVMPTLRSEHGAYGSRAVGIAFREALRRNSLQEMDNGAALPLVLAYRKRFDTPPRRANAKHLKAFISDVCAALQPLPPERAVRLLAFFDRFTHGLALRPP
jgi:radical SAM superfamily enzyme YgiQ (UPF0313 family)